MYSDNNTFNYGSNPVSKGLMQLLRWVVILLMTLLVLDVVWGVATRYILGQQAQWTEELARLLLVWVSLFGASLAFGMKAHLGLDYFAGKLDPSAGKINAIVGAGVVLVFTVLVFIYGGWLLVRDTMESGQQMIALPLSKWWAYAALPVSGIFMLVFAVDQLVESFRLRLETNERRDAR